MMMTWHIDERRGFSSEGLGEDLSAAGSEGKSLQTVTTGRRDRDREGYGLRTRNGLG